MKKTGTLILAILLMLCLSTSVFAFNAARSPQKLMVDGRIVDCEKYNIDGSNYFKLRDLAALLNGTGSQFDVGWDAAAGVVSITTGIPYTSRDGTELVVGPDRSSTATMSPQTIMINGTVRSDLTVYNVGGSNYFKLRDLGDAIGFSVSYDELAHTAVVVSQNSVPRQITLYKPIDREITVSSSELESRLVDGWSTSPIITQVRDTPVRIFDQPTLKMNSVGGASFYIHWNNQSDKVIKYIHFFVTPYNRVGDKVRCEIWGVSTQDCWSTGPYAKVTVNTDWANLPETMWIDTTTQGHPSYGDGFNSSIYVTHDGKYYRGLSDPLIPVPEYRYIDVQFSTYWENMWYNSDIHSLRIEKVQIEYMDGTEKTITGKALENCFY